MHRSSSRLSRQAGLTIMEITAATVIFAMVLAFVAYLTFFVGKQTHIQTRTSRAELTNRNAAELIRHQLRMAKSGSSIVVSGDHDTISFNNPVYGSVTSQFTFEPTQNTLRYYQDTNESPYRVVTGLGDVSFDVYDFGSIIDVTLQSDASALGGDMARTVEQEFVVRPRN
jgi:type II secretory pathway pseudopilin PulG